MARRKTKNFKIPFKLIGISLSFISIILILAAVFKAFFYHYSYFNISRIVIKGAEEDKYAEFKKHFTGRLMGKNIFSQKLSLVKRQIEEELGDVECRAIQRRLPGELIVYLSDRSAVAQLKLGRFYPIDAGAVIMENPSDLANPYLPVIAGLEDAIESPRKGKLCPAPELKKVIELIEQRNSSPGLSGYLITKVSLAKNGTSSFFIVHKDESPGVMEKSPVKKHPSGDALKKSYPIKEVEVKFDLNRPGDVINVLALLLDKRANSSGALSALRPLADVEYIDLKDPDSPAVLETKNEKQK